MDLQALADSMSEQGWTIGLGGCLGGVRRHTWSEPFGRAPVPAAYPSPKLMRDLGHGAVLCFPRLLRSSRNLLRSTTRLRARNSLALTVFTFSPKMSANSCTEKPSTSFKSNNCRSRSGKISRTHRNMLFVSVRSSSLTARRPKAAFRLRANACSFDNSDS